MKLLNFIAKNAFRNKRRSLLTVLSIGFGLLLLTVMMTIWRAFYIDRGSVESSHRLVTRQKVSMAFFLPIYYRKKIRAVPGVKHVVNDTWFGGQYKNDRPENFFAQFGTDPEEWLDVFPEFQMPHDELVAWQHDQAGCVADRELAKKHGWKIGDRIYIKGMVFPVNLDLTLRGIFVAPTSTETLVFNYKYLEEAYPNIKSRVGWFMVLADSAESVPRVAEAIDAIFRNAPRATKTETEKAFQLDYIAMLGNVKAFLMSICMAVVFATLLVSANTMAMSIRERTREVAVLKALGFTRSSVLGLFISEAMTLSLSGGLLGSLAAWALVGALARTPQTALLLGSVRITLPTILAALAVAAILGLASSFAPAFNASRKNIVDGLRYVG